VARTGQPWDADEFVGAVVAVFIVVEPADNAMTAVQCITGGYSAADIP